MRRLDQLIAHNLGISRKATARLIARGRVREPGGEPVDGRKLLKNAEFPVLVEIDHEPVELVAAMHVALHKPAGVVTAMKDPDHPIAADLVRDLPLGHDLRPVGRLDKETTGLLLWTTDGQLLHRLTHRRFQVRREYHVALARPHAPLPDRVELADGHVPTILGLHAMSREQAHPALAAPPDATNFVRIELGSGSYHEVRRIFAALGSHVLGLARVAHGPIRLDPDHPVGEVRRLDLPALVAEAAS